MVRYYCEYCHSYLTHDTLSVRKSHLIGKNHLRVTSDYYRNKHICSLYKKQPKLSNKKKKKAPSLNQKQNNKNNNETTLSSKKIAIHPLSNREKKINRKIKTLFDKELNNTFVKIYRNKKNNIYKQDNILSTLYDGSPGYSKVFIESNRFDIGDSIKQSRLPQRANQNDTGNMINRSTNPDLSKRDRNEVYQGGDIVSDKINLLPPPLVLSIWANTIPKYQIYNNNNYNNMNTNFKSIIPPVVKSNNTTSITPPNGIGKNPKRRYNQSEEIGKYKKRKF